MFALRDLRSNVGESWDVELSRPQLVQAADQCLFKGGVCVHDNL